jgi:prepilin-type N-terminal cleavage/methylation domain-containing protein
MSLLIAQSRSSLRARPLRRDARAPRARRGLTLVEVVVALSILGGVLLGLGMFSVRLSQATSAAKMRITAAQLAADRMEAVKGAPRYSAIESLFVATEAIIPNNAGYSRRTWVTRVGGLVTDTIDYKIVTVQVTNSQMSSNVRKTTVIAPF